MVISWLIGSVAIFICLLFAFRSYKRKRLINDMPTSKAKGVFIGLVELKGKADCDTPLTSYLTETPCIYHKWAVEEHWSKRVTETYTDSKGHTKTRTKTESGWKTVASDMEMIEFNLCDDTGSVQIRPEKAKIEAIKNLSQVCGRSDPIYYGKGPAESIMHSDHRRRFTEYLLKPDSDLYIFGQSMERKDKVAPEISWEKGTPLFLISTRDEGKVSRGLGIKFWGLLILGLLAALGAAYFSLDRSFRFDREPLSPYIFSTGIYLTTAFLGWFIITFNSLKSLFRRVEQGWSQIEVQLKRRHDLIPLLEAAVKGLARYEKSTQEYLAALRGEMESSSTIVAIKALIENYPELGSQSAFISLQKELIDTEDRIALARQYYNNIATFYNARVEKFPDMIVAKFAGLKKQKLFQIGESKSTDD